MTLIRGMSNARYHSLPALSSSGMKKLAQSPAHYKYQRDNPPKSTPAMQIGTAFHSLVLEPETFGDAVAISPDINRRTKAGRAEYAEFEADLGDRVVIKQADMDNLYAMAQAVNDHPEASALLGQPGAAELSCFWQDRRGYDCKCRPDWLTESGIVVDLKSTEDASPREFARSCAKFKYHWQAAFYLNGLTVATGYKHNNFILIAVEKTPPYGVGVYQMPQVYTDIAAQQIEPILDLYGECLKHNSWPCYSDNVVALEMPVYSLKIGD